MELPSWLRNVPEYPHSPAAQRDRPTAININGKISHRETELRAGHRKAARGYAGRLLLGRPVVDGAFEEGSLPLLVCLTFRRGLWGEGPAIVTVDCW